MARMFLKSVMFACLAAGLVLAQQQQEEEAQLQGGRCDVSVARSQCGALTRIQSGENVAFVMVNPNGTWKAFTSNSGELKAIDSGSSSLGAGPNELVMSTTTTLPLPEEPTAGQDDASQKKAEFDQLMARNLQGARFSYENGKLNIVSSNGQKMALRTPTELAQQMLYGDCKGRNIVALDLNGKSYTHAFYQNATVAVFVDSQCKLVAAPTSQLSTDQASLVADMQRQGANDNRHGPRGPPPSFFQRFNPLNFFRGQPDQQPPQPPQQRPPQPPQQRQPPRQPFNLF